MQIRTPSAARRAVLDFAAIGFHLVPVYGIHLGACTCKKGIECPKGGKHPKQRKWQGKGTCNADEILAWWQSPLPNVGVVTGSVSGIVVVDVDGDEGQKTLNDLAAKEAAILNTRTHRTGSGGLHLFYRYPDFTVGNSVRLLPGIDVRGNAGLIVLPPSLHVSGRRYEVTNDREIAALPEMFRQSLTQCHKERQRDTRSNKELPRETRQVGVVVCVHSASSVSLQPFGENVQQLEWAVKNSLPTKQGRRNRQVFELARYLLTVPEITKDVPLLQFRPLVEVWLQLAKEQAERFGFKIQGDIEETWSDFVFAWDRVKYAIGGGLASVFDLVAEMDSGGEVNPFVWDVLVTTHRTEDPNMRLLIGVLYHLAQLNIDEPFSLACAAGAEQFRRFGFSHVDRTWVHRRLQTLTDERVIVRVDAGKSGTRGLGQAAKYRWVWNVLSIPEQGLSTSGSNESPCLNSK